MHFPCLIIGGGIAGITCIETLHLMDIDLKMGLITSTDTVKSVTNLHRITKLIEDFEVSEKSTDEVSQRIPTVTIIKAIVDFIKLYHIQIPEKLITDELFQCRQELRCFIRRSGDIL